MNRNSLTISLLAAVVGGGVLSPAPARADDAAVERELEALKQRVQQLEEELAKGKKAPAPAGTAKPAGDAAAVTGVKGSRLTFGGWAQLRFTDIGGSSGARTATGSTNFEVTRFRPRLNYQLDKHWLASLQLDATTRGAGTTLTLRDAYAQYSNAGYLAKLGQQKAPFGYQIYRETSEMRIPLERARVFNTVFPNARDLGVVLATNSKNTHAPTFSLGVLNGDSINTSDGDKAKSVAGNATLPIGKHNVIGASAYTGTTTAAGVSRVKTAVGVEHRLNWGRLGTQAEYLWGRALGADLNGGFLQVTYNTGRIGGFFARHQVFDPNADLGGDYYRATGFGWWKDLSKNLRITAEYDLAVDRATPTSDNTFGVQIQTSF
jgi:hypothetical protein